MHRDVKPENVLLGEDDEALHSDFGIALVTQKQVARRRFLTVKTDQELSSSLFASSSRPTARKKRA